MSGPVGRTEQEVILTIVVPLTPSCIFKEAVASGSKAAGSEVSELIPQPLPGQAGQRGRSLRASASARQACGRRPAGGAMEPAQAGVWLSGAREGRGGQGGACRSRWRRPQPASSCPSVLTLRPKLSLGGSGSQAGLPLLRSLELYPQPPPPPLSRGGFNSRIASPHWPVAPWPRPRRPPTRILRD